MPVKNQSQGLQISIHALLAESDADMSAAWNRFTHFYPRSPCGERLGNVVVELPMWKFLSTLSLRRATRSPGFGFCRPRYFYPRSPCGERLVNGAGRLDCFGISIHALLAESDQQTAYFFWAGGTFLSTLSLRRATPIGTLRTVSVKNFYPRSPCGERPWQRGSRITYVEISIHALLAESDAFSVAFVFGFGAISIHALLAESDGSAWVQEFPELYISIHALLAESDRIHSGRGQKL